MTSRANITTQINSSLKWKWFQPSLDSSGLWHFRRDSDDESSLSPLSSPTNNHKIRNTWRRERYIHIYLVPRFNQVFHLEKGRREKIRSGKNKRYNSILFEPVTDHLWLLHTTIHCANWYLELLYSLCSTCHGNLLILLVRRSTGMKSNLLLYLSEIQSRYTPLNLRPTSGEIAHTSHTANSRTKKLTCTYIVTRQHQRQ